MSNGNGFTKLLITVLLMALAAIGSLIVIGADSLSSKIDTIDADVDTLEERVSKQEINIAKFTLQMAGVAKALGVPVVVDTSAADARLRDST